GRVLLFLLFHNSLSTYIYTRRLHSINPSREPLFLIAIWAHN
ncbi:unnamed protein product, partial [Linum tenue]